MSVDLLLREFERLAEAPDAIGRLRRFILDLGVRGRLVEQHAGDSSAALLLEEVVQAPRDTPLSPRYGRIVDAPIVAPPFQVPRPWVWTRLGRVADYIQRGKSPKYSTKGGPPVVSQKCVRWEGLDMGPARAVTEASLLDYEPVRFLREGDLLWNSTGTGTIGRVSRVTAPSSRLVCDSHVTIVRCSNLNSEFVRCWLRSDHVYGSIESAASGSTNQVELTLQMAMSQPVPLPPLAEQNRIVAKVDELMRLCEEIEVVDRERETRRGALRRAAIHLLSTPDVDVATTATDIRFFLDNTARMITKADHVDGVRQTVLEMAVSGRLVPQDPRDEPGSELLKRAHERKARLLADGLTRKVASPAPIHDDERPGVAPAGWEWTRLQDVATLITKGTTPTSVGHDFASHGVNFVKVETITHGELLPENVRSFISSETNDYLARSRLACGDILFSIAGSIGKCAVVREDMLPANTNQALAIIRGTDVVFDASFLLGCIRSSVAHLVLGKARGGAMNNISLGDLRNFVVPVPPLAEQKRIVATVSELMVICDDLEIALASADADRSRLLETLLHETLREASGPASARPVAGVL